MQLGAMESGKSIIPTGCCNEIGLSYAIIQIDIDFPNIRSIFYH